MGRRFWKQGAFSRNTSWMHIHDSLQCIRKGTGLRTLFDHGLVKDLNSQRAAHSWLSFLAFGFILHTPCKAPAADCISIAILWKLQRTFFFFALLGNTFLSRCLGNSGHNYAKARVDEKSSVKEARLLFVKRVCQERAWCGGKNVSLVENAEFAYWFQHLVLRHGTGNFQASKISFSCHCSL